MRATSKLLALALTAALQPAVAGVISLDFEDNTSIAKIDNRYSAQGVNFAGDAWSIGSNQNGCPGAASFSRAGSCAGLLLAADPGQQPGTGGLSFTIDVADGFITEFSFVYGIRSRAVTVDLFDDLDGKGNRLKSLVGLGGRTTCSTDLSLRFCDWYSASIVFGGVARSVVVTGLDQGLMLDDLKFITPAVGPAPLPEPGSIALALGALGAMGWARKRTKL